MNSKNIMWGVGVVILTIVGLWGIWKLTTAPANQTQQEAVEIEIVADDHIKGNPEAPITLVEYSDFQCPACRAYAPLVRQVMEANPDSVRVVYRHFPLAQHQNAEIASYAGEAAAKQDKFFEFHDILFDRQDDWAEEDNPTDLFTKYAEELELDVDQFKTDMNSGESKERVERDLTEGIGLGVNSTPSFFLNGSKLRNPSSLEEFQTLIDDALSAETDSEVDDTSDEASEEAAMDSEAPTEETEDTAAEE